MHMTKESPIQIDTLNPTLISAIEQLRSRQESLAQIAIDVFQERQWKVKIVPKDATVRKMTTQDRDVLCGDDRDIDPGINIFGATLGVQELIGDGSAGGTMKAIQLLKSLGLIPTMHTDEVNHGCGQDNLSNQGELSYTPERTVPTDEIVGLVLTAQPAGKYKRLYGGHAATSVQMNVAPGTVPIEKPKDQFRVTAWAITLIQQLSHPEENETELEELYIKALNSTAETVEKLGRSAGPRNLQLVQ